MLRLENLQIVILTVAAYGAALLLAGGIVWGIAWLLRNERPAWLQAITAISLIGFFIIYPLILLIYSWVNVDPYQPYDDRPYQENKYDRYG